MNLQHNSSHDWQRMAMLVSQSSLPLKCHPWQFRKLVVLRRLSENILVMLLQYTGLMMTTLSSTYSPLWFATGTACAFIFLRGYSVFPGIWLGTFFAYYLTSVNIGLACVSATIFTLQAFFILWFSYRFITPTLIFYRYTTFLKFIVCSTIITGISSLILELFYTVVLHAVIAAPLQLWLQWWLANLNGIFVISFALITLDAYFPQVDALKRQNFFYLGLAYGLLLVVIGALFYFHHALWIVNLAISMLLTWVISAYFGWCGTVAAIFLFGMILSLFVYLDAPAFAMHFSLEKLILLQFVLVMEAITGLFIAMKAHL